MATPIEDHTRKLGIKGKTLERLKAINIHTLEDLAESSIDTIRGKLMCTRERAMVLIMRSKRTLRHFRLNSLEEHQPNENLADERW